MTRFRFVLIYSSLFITLLSFNNSRLFSQEVMPEEEKPARFIDKIVFGGDFGIVFGTSTYIQISPIVGYKLTDRLTTAIGFTYIYSKNKDEYLDTTANPDPVFREYTVSQNTYGFRGLVTYTLFKNVSDYIPIDLGNIVIHIEDEALNIETLKEDPATMRLSNSGNRVWANNLLLGGGLSYDIGSKSSFYLVILFNITPNKYTPYSNPIFKVGFYL